MVRTHLKATLENGNSFTPAINLPQKEAIEYYLGKYFNFGDEDDLMLKVVSVEVIHEETIYKTIGFKTGKTIWAHEDTTTGDIVAAIYDMPYEELTADQIEEELF